MCKAGMLAATYGGLLAGVASVDTGWAALMAASLVCGALGALARRGSAEEPVRHRPVPARVLRPATGAVRG